jgi:hypothetical protein
MELVYDPSETPGLVVTGNPIRVNPADSANARTYCESSSSWRWVHASHTVICYCAAGKWRSQESQCENHQCSQKLPLKCTLCTNGKYQPSEDTTACQACSGGMYQGSIGSTSCTACTAGQYQASSGQSTCKSCQPGQHQSDQEERSALHVVLVRFKHLKGHSPVYHALQDSTAARNHHYAQAVCQAQSRTHWELPMG